MIKSYKDLIELLRKDGENGKVDHLAYTNLSFYYEQILNDSSSCSVKRYSETVISGILLGLSYANYISDESLELLRQEAIDIAY